MKEEKWSLVSDVDGLSLSVMAFVPDGEVKGIVQIAHGMCEYKERYTDFMEYLAEGGYMTIIHDHRGHGDSVESEADLGYMYEGGAEGLVEDTHQLTLMAKGMLPDVPFILLGHSMGSLIVRCYAKKYDDEIDKLIVVGSPSRMAGADLGLGLTRLSEKKRGSRGKWKLLDILITGMNYERPFRKEGPNAWVCSDKEVLEKHNNDPKCNYKFTVSAYNNLIRLMKATYDDKGWQVKNPGLEIMFASGENDVCAGGAKAWEESRDFMKKMGYENICGKMYPGMRHEILNEKGKEQVYADMLAFIEG